MQIEQITEKYYLFMVVGIPTTDITSIFSSARDGHGKAKVPIKR